MKQAQQMQEQMQRQLEQAQQELSSLEVTGEAGGGMIKVVMTGRHDVRRVQIDPALMGDDREMLEDLLAAAVNDAVRKVETTTQQKMSGLTSGLNLPPGLKLPF
jgi:DNA-binding YbaB/EbfC family protein